MKTGLLIAEGGGSTCKWCYIDTNGERKYFETESYHPSNWSDAFFERSNGFWKNHLSKGSALYFYGAGLSVKKNQDKLREHFMKLGYVIKDITSDAEGTFTAYFKDGPGVLAILGTGSVLWQRKRNGKIEQIGGLGHLLGDEGSAYYFAKLFLEAWKNGELAAPLCMEIEQSVSVEEVYQLFEIGEKQEVARLAKCLAPWENEPSITAIHEKNVELFIQKHLVQENYDGLDMLLIGSYALAQKQRIKRLLATKKMKSLTFEQTALEALVNAIRF